MQRFFQMALKWLAFSMKSLKLPIGWETSPTDVINEALEKRGNQFYSSEANTVQILTKNVGSQFQSLLRKIIVFRIMRLCN